MDDAASTRELRLSFICLNKNEKVYSNPVERGLCEATERRWPRTDLAEQLTTPFEHPQMKKRNNHWIGGGCAFLQQIAGCLTDEFLHAEQEKEPLRREDRWEKG